MYWRSKVTVNFRSSLHLELKNLEIFWRWVLKGTYGDIYSYWTIVTHTLNYAKIIFNLSILISSTSCKIIFSKSKLKDKDVCIGRTVAKIRKNVCPKLLTNVSGTWGNDRKSEEWENLEIRKWNKKLKKNLDFIKNHLHLIWSAFWLL